MSHQNAPEKSPHQQVFDLLLKGKAHEADESALSALVRYPYDSLLFALRAEAHNALGKPDEAMAFAKRSLSHHPYERRALAAIGVALCLKHDYLAAKRALDHVLSSGKDILHARWMRAFTNLALYEFEEGFADYEFGFLTGARPLRCPPHKAWTGGKTDVLFIYGEQGLGDHIMYSRFIKMAKERSGAMIVLETRPELIGVFDSMADMVYSIQGDGALPVEYTAHVGMLSLPHVLGLKKVSGAAYIEPEQFEWDLKGAQVGFAWCGNPDHSMDAGRSLTLEEAKTFEGLAPFGLLQPFGENPFAMPRINGPDMAATMAIIDKLDLVVTVDTSICHLAGACGKECWMIAPKTGEWRWGIEGSHSPWYDSIEIFRCPNGERQPAIDEVQRRLRLRYPDWKPAKSTESLVMEQHQNNLAASKQKRRARKTAQRLPVAPGVLNGSHELPEMAGVSD